VDGKRATVITPEGVQRISVRASSSFQNTIVSQEAARQYRLDRKRLKRALGIMGPTGVTIWVTEDYEVLFPLGNPHGGKLKIMAHGVDSLEEYCREPEGSLKRLDMQLGKKDVGIMKLQRTVHLLADEWEEAASDKVVQSVPTRERATLRFLAYGEKGEWLWLKAVQF
jgi:hypothetical protein